MSETTPLDDRGRFTVDPKWRKKLGRRVVQIWTPGGLLLVPLKGLKPGALGNALAASKNAEQAALDEIGEELREIHGER